mgnify:CR=1 FL=1
MTDQRLLDDQQMLIELHNTARMLEGADYKAGREMRQIADRFAELIKNAHSRRHWCNGNEK